MTSIYLDNAATTAIHPEVLQEMFATMQNIYGNPSSIHSKGRQARSLIEQARKTVATLLNVSPAEIFFTSGGTEADNMAIKKVISTLGIRHIISTKIEHHAVKEALASLNREGLAEVSYVDIDRCGNLDYAHLEALLKQSPKSLVSLMHANNEIGTIHDISRIGQICEHYDAIFHSDTVQTMGHLKHDLQSLKIHSAVCSAHKFHGPKGIGFIYINKNLKIQPFIHGGSQERNMRGGTENIYGIVGLAKALEIAYNTMREDATYIQGLKNYMIEQLRARLTGVEFNGEIDSTKSLYTVLNVSFPPSPKAETLLFSLDIAGICVSGGSACTSGIASMSYVLQHIGSEENRPAIRFSFSKHNTKEELDIVVEELVRLYS